MKSLYSTAALAALIISAQSITAKEAVCHRCEEVREYNAEHHKNYEYYDDYAKSDDFDKDDDNPFITKEQAPAASGVKTPKPAAPVADRNTKGAGQEWKTSPQNK